MRGARRAVVVAWSAVALVASLLAASPGQAGAVPVGQALAAPHAFAGGGVIGFGLAHVPPAITSPLNSEVVTMVSNPAAPASNQGDWLASADGGVFAQGDAGFYGSLGAEHLTGPVVAMAATPDGGGYWMAALDGGVFAFGDAGYYGSMGGMPLNQPIVGMAATPDGRGYWLVASDGGIFSFGDAAFLGSMGGTPLVAPVVGMAPTHDGPGYWLVASDGGIFAYGGARFFGSTGGIALGDPVAGMASMPDDGGYYLVGTGGSVFTFGDAPFRGDLAGGLGGNSLNVLPLAGIAVAPGAVGYWLLDPDGFNYSFANPAAASPTAADIVAAAASQVNADPDTGYFCNPYGPCEEWCALFATWVWEQAGVPVPNYAFTGDMYDWAAANTGVLPPDAPPLPGDAVLYGTGPSSVATSWHVGVVVQVWPDGAVITVEGDSGPGPTGHLAVIINGPYLPSDSWSYNGMPIYGFAQP